MIKDPIVEEVRRAGEKLARDANYDLHTFFENLRKREREWQARLAKKRASDPNDAVKPEVFASISTTDEPATS